MDTEVFVEFHNERFAEVIERSYIILSHCDDHSAPDLIWNVNIASDFSKHAEM